MFSNRLFYVFVVVALVVMAGLTVRQSVVTTQVVSGASSSSSFPLDQHERHPSDAAPIPDVVERYMNIHNRSNVSAALDQPERHASENTIDYTRLYRSPLDECFDVPLREVCDK